MLKINAGKQKQQNIKTSETTDDEIPYSLFPKAKASGKTNINQEQESPPA